MSSENELIIISTCLYGKTESDSKIHNIRDILCKNILDNHLTKIKCQIKPNEGIYGIQLIYQNLVTNEEKPIINIISKETNLIEQEMSLNLEYILDVKFWVNDECKLMGFEIITNKGNFKKFGYGKDEHLKLCHELKNKERAVVGFNIIESEKNGIIGMSLYHMNKRTYDFYVYKGIFCLRAKIRNEQNKNEIGKKLDKMNDIQKKILYKICCLSDNQFFSVIKFTFN